MQVKPRRPVQSAQRAWLLSKSVAIYYKCCRWALMDKCLSALMKGKTRVEGVQKMIPLEHRLIQQVRPCRNRTLAHVGHGPIDIGVSRRGGGVDECAMGVSTWR